MIKIKGLENFGTWLRKGEVVVVNNNLGLTVVKEGKAKILGYVDGIDKRIVGKGEMERRIKLLKKYNIPLRTGYGLKFMIDFLTKLEKCRKEDEGVKK